MTDSTVNSADFSGILAARTHAEEAERQRNIRRAVVAALVVLLHILILAGFMVSGRIPIVITHIRVTEPEAIWVFTPPAHKPKPPQVLPPPEEETLPQPVIPAPITLPQMRPARPLAPPAHDGIEGVWRELACGAGSYENLTPLQREQCIRHPWHMIRRPDGTIRLEPPPKEEPPPSIADIMRHEQQTAPPCPILNNTPCLGKVIHGDSLGGGPRPF